MTDNHTPIPAPPAQRVPVVWGDDCRYCTRYALPCGRHEDLTIRPAVRPIWTPEDYAQTVRDAAAHRANPSNVVAL